MKKSILLFPLISIMCFITYAQETELYTPLNIKQAYENGTRSPDGTPGQNYWQNRADYFMEIKLDPVSATLSGKESIHYYNNSPDTLEEIVFHLFPDYFKEGNPKEYSVRPTDLHDGVDINRFRLNGEEVGFSGRNRRFVPQSTGFIFYPQKPLMPGSKTEIKIEWEYQINRHSHMRTGMVDESSFFIAYFFPRIAVYDDLSGWNIQSYTGMKEFYNDFGDFEVSIEVPQNYIVWATGILENPEEVLNRKYYEKYQTALESDRIIHIVTAEEADEKAITRKNIQNRWQFRASDVTDFAFATSDHYLWDASSLVVDQSNGRRVLVDAAYNVNSSDFHRVAQIARDAVEVMSTKIPGTPYPFPRITVFNGLSEMEYPMMVNDMSVGESMVVSLTSHEIFHSYFPFLVGTNETKYAWMDEGWATFADHLITQELEPEHAFGIYFMDLFENNMKAGRDLPLYTHSDILGLSDYWVNSYPKASSFNMMLKDLMGDELFYKVLREYIARWRGKHPMPYDYFNTFSQASGIDLNWLFQSWFFEFGYADLGITEVIRKDDQTEIIIKNNGSLPTPIFLEVQFDDGTKQKFHEKVSVWENGKSSFPISITSDQEIKVIKLGNKLFPDADKANNLYFP